MPIVESQEVIEVCWISFIVENRYYVDKSRIEHTWLFRDMIVTPGELKTEIVKH